MDVQDVVLPENLKSLRAARGWTQLQAAEVVGVWPSTWCNWERGKYRPRDFLVVTKLLQLLNTLGLEDDH